MNQNNPFSKDELTKAEEKFNAEQAKSEQAHDGEIQVLDEAVEEKQKYISNLEIQLKKSLADNTKTKENLENTISTMHHLEIKLLNSSEEKIAELKSDHEAQIRAVNEAQNALQTNFHATVQNHKVELQLLQDENSQLSTALSKMISTSKEVTSLDNVMSSGEFYCAGTTPITRARGVSKTPTVQPPTVQPPTVISAPAEVKKTKGLGPVLKVGTAITLMVLYWRYSMDIHNVIDPFTASVSTGLHNVGSETAKHSRVLWVKTEETVTTAATSLSNLLPPEVTNGVKIPVEYVKNQAGHVITFGREQWNGIYPVLQPYMQSLHQSGVSTVNVCNETLTPMVETLSTSVNAVRDGVTAGVTAGLNYVTSVVQMDTDAMADKIGDFLISVHRTIHAQ